MKKLLMIVLAGTLAFTGSTWAKQNDAPAADLVAMGTYYIPEDTDVYDDGGGAELQLRLWMNEYVGLSLAGGWARWDVDNQNAVVRDGNIISAAETSGDIDVIPVGASLLIRVFDNDRLSLILEGGARYVFIDDNDADVDIVIVRPGRTLAGRDHLEIDDGVVALAAAHLEFKLTRDVFLLAGGGYQWDIDKGDVKFLDQKIKNNNLEAALVQAGLGVRF